MKIKFNCNNGANIHSKKTEELTTKDLGLSDEEWMEMTDDEKHAMAVEWANEHIEIWYEEVE